MGCALTCSLSSCKILVFSVFISGHLYLSLWHGLETLHALTACASLCWLLAELPMDLR